MRIAYREPVVYNLAVLRELGKQVYISEKLAPPTNPLLSLFRENPVDCQPNESPPVTEINNFKFSLYLSNFHNSLFNITIR